MPLVSIIIPAYNAEATVKRAIRCALDQSVVDVEAVVVDDGSTDATADAIAELAAQDARVVAISHAENKGRLEARRTGVNAASGVYTMFLDADDELALDACERAIAASEGSFGIVQFDFDYAYAGFADERIKRVNSEFSRPAATTAQGLQVTHLVFRDRATTWSLCGKLMRTADIRAAFAEVEPQRMERAEDACVFFILSTIAGSYKGVPGYKGYTYHIDAGGTSAMATRIALEEFAERCRYVDAMDAIADYVARAGFAKELAADVETVRREHCLTLADKLLTCVDAKDRPAALERFFETWPVEEALASLADVGWEAPAETALALNPGTASRAFATSTREVKTIGVYHFAMGSGGAEKVAAWLCRLWKGMGYNVVFFADEPASACQHGLPEGTPWVQLPESFSTKRETYATRAKLIAQALRTYHIDVFVHHQWWNPLLTWDMLLLKALDVPFCLFNHAAYRTFFCEGHPWELDAVRTLRFADGLVVLSEADARFWSEHAPRVWQSANPATIDPATAPQNKPGSHEVLWVGRLSAFDKQPAEALEVFARVAARDDAATLTMVGGSSSRDVAPLKTLARKLGIEAKVTFAGLQTNLAPFYERAGVLLCTSRWESWGLALAEAKSCGLPAVMYALPALETAKDNRGIIAVDQGDRDGAAEAIVQLLADDVWRAQLGQEAHKHARELAGFDFEALWRTLFGELGQGSPERAGFEQADEKWDMVLGGMQEGLGKALYAPVASYAKRKGIAAARNIWHRIRG